MVGRSARAASDADLARALAAGDDWALGQTWERLAPMVLTLSERYLGSRFEAEDIAQEVFYRLFRKASLLRDPRRLRSFVYAFAMHALHIELRRRKRRAWLSFEEPETIADMRSVVPDPEARDLLEKVHTLLGRLKPRDRSVFMLKRVDSMTLEEISQLLNIPLSTVKRSMTQSALKVNRWIDADPELTDFFATIQVRR